MVRFDQTGLREPRLGNQMEEDVPRNVYATAMAAYCHQLRLGRIFENLLMAMGRMDLVADPRFTSMAARVAEPRRHRRHRRRVDASQSTDRALLALERHQVVAGRINDIADVLETRISLPVRRS